MKSLVTDYFTIPPATAPERFWELLFPLPFRDGSQGRVPLAHDLRACQPVARPTSGSIAIFELNPAILPPWDEGCDGHPAWIP